MWLAGAGSSTLTGYDRQCRSYDASPSFVTFGPSSARPVFRCPLPRSRRQPPLHWGCVLRWRCCNFSVPSVCQPLLVRITFLSQLLAVFKVLVTACRWPRRRLEVKTCRCYVASSTWLAARALGLAFRANTCVYRRWGASLGSVAGLASHARRLFARAFRGRLPSTTAIHREPKTPCNYARSNRTLRLS